MYINYLYFPESRVNSLLIIWFFQWLFLSCILYHYQSVGITVFVVLFILSSVGVQLQVYSVAIGMYIYCLHQPRRRLLTCGYRLWKGPYTALLLGKGDSRFNRKSTYFQLFCCVTGTFGLSLIPLRTFVFSSITWDGWTRYLSFF